MTTRALYLEPVDRELGSEFRGATDADATQLGSSMGSVETSNGAMLRTASVAGPLAKRQKHQTTVSETTHGFVWRCSCGYWYSVPAPQHIASAGARRHRKASR